MTPKLLTTALAAAMALAIAAPATAASPPLDLGLVRGGAVLAPPVVDGSRVYMPTGRVLATWDYTDPTAPVRVSTSAPAGGAINGLVRMGNHLYASWRGHDGTSGVATFSVAQDPDAPVLLSDNDAYVADYKTALGLAVANGHLYLFDNSHGMFVGNLSDPANPSFSFAPGTDTVTQYTRFVVLGNRIHASGRGWNWSTNLDIFDVSNPTAPVVVASHGTDGIDTFALLVEKGRAIGIGNRLTMFDLSDPTQLVPRAALDIPPANNGARVGNYLYSYGWGEGIDIWNVASLDAPKAVGHFDIATLGGGRSARVGDSLLLQTDTDLLHAISVAKPQQPARQSTSWMPVGVGARDVEMHEGRAVLLQPNYGLTVNDADTLAPLGRFEAALPQSLAERSFEQLEISGDTAWLAAWGFGLIGVDLSNPAKPVETGRLEYPFAAVLEIQGKYAYVARWTNGGAIAAVDVSNPASPAVRSQVGVASQPYAMRAHGGYLYVAEGTEGGDTGGLRVFSLANPANPVPVARLDDGCEAAFDLEIDSEVSLAYVACSGGVHVVDIEDPRAPVVVGRYDAGRASNYTRVEQRGDTAWFADLSGVHELDVTDPTAPALKRVTSLGHQSAERLFALDDGRLFALGGATGLHVFGQDIEPLEDGVPVKGLAGTAGDDHVFALEVPAGARAVTIVATGGRGAIELQVKRGGVPTDGDHDQRAVRSPKAAMVRLHGPVADTYYIRLVGAAAYSGVTVQASY